MNGVSVTRLAKAGWTESLLQKAVDLGLIEALPKSSGGCRWTEFRPAGNRTWSQVAEQIRQHMGEAA